MFFPARIQSIKETDRVLEIGPGATPHPRSDIFLEKIYDTDEELILQSGNVGKLQTEKKVIFYKGGQFPFADKEFDYVICSHVLEHVDDVPAFLEEIMRVAKRGYLEFPTIYYDYYNDIPTHLNMLRYKDGVVLWCKKNETPIPSLKPFTIFFNSLQERGYRMQNEVNHAWHQGFEFDEKISYSKVNHWSELCYTKEELDMVILKPSPIIQKYQPGIKASLKSLVKAVSRKFKK
jgi:SAM-dependent methyltransferase